MMIVFAYIVGLGLPAVNGWLLLGMFERTRGLLDRVEHWTAGAVIGMTFTMFVTFCAHVALHLPLSRMGFLSVQVILLIILGILWRFLQPRGKMPERTSMRTIPRWVKITLWTLVGWVVVKALIAGTVFLFLTPTFLDDSLDNWNLRGKMFFADQSITMPVQDAANEAFMKGVGSYPPAVPMAKAWIASLAGAWSDAAANGIHLFYYIAALLLIARTVRRLAGPGWDLFAVYLLGSMPLYLMHGTNPYADAFLSVHVLLAIIFPLRAMTVLRQAPDSALEATTGRQDDKVSFMALMRMGAICAALLPFTKNEALLLYLPPLLLIGAIGLLIGVRRRRITASDALQVIGWYAGLLLILALPWLMYKWANGLTFGNAKPFSTVDITWQAGVLQAIVVNALFEGNWLFFFPLLIGLLIWRRRAAFGRWSPLTAYVLIVCLGQWTIFLFTSLSVEAKMQTGLARGGVQLMPSFMLLTVLLLADAWPILQRGCLAAGRSVGIVRA